MAQPRIGRIGVEKNYASTYSSAIRQSRAGARRTLFTTLRRGREARKIPAVVAMTGTADRITYAGAFGTRDAESEMKVGMDSIFAIASMTKAVTSTAAMQLVERGKLTLDEPASKYLPELGMLQVLEGFDGAANRCCGPHVRQ